MILKLTRLKDEAASRELKDAMHDTRKSGCADGAHVHVVHLSDAKNSLDLIKDAKSSGASVSVETCPHYLAFAAEEIADGDLVLSVPLLFMMLPIGSSYGKHWCPLFCFSFELQHSFGEKSWFCYLACIYFPGG